MGAIYKILNVVTGDFYIGSTNNYKRRTTEHRRYLRRNNHSNSKLQRAFNKYGESAFVFGEIITNVPDKLLIKTEQDILNEFNPAYNICREVSRTVLGVKKNPDSVLKGVKSLKESIRNGAYIPHRYWLGRKRSDSTKNKISKIHKGSKRSEEYKYKLSISRSKILICVYDDKLNLIEKDVRNHIKKKYSLTTVQLGYLLWNKYGHFGNYIFRKEGDTPVLLPHHKRRIHKKKIIIKNRDYSIKAIYKSRNEFSRIFNYDKREVKIFFKDKKPGVYKLFKNKYLLAS